MNFTCVFIFLVIIHDHSLCSFYFLQSKNMSVTIFLQNSVFLLYFIPCHCLNVETLLSWSSVLFIIVENLHFWLTIQHILKTVTPKDFGNYIDYDYEKCEHPGNSDWPISITEYSEDVSAVQSRLFNLRFLK